MIAVFIFIIILLSLLLCCSCSQMYYQEGIDEPIQSEPKQDYQLTDDQFKELMQSVIVIKEQLTQQLIDIFNKPPIPGPMGPTGPAGPTGPMGPIGSTGPMGLGGQQYISDNRGTTGSNNNEPLNNNNNYTVDYDNYILKSSVVPPICPACPSILYPDANAFESHDKKKKKRKNKSESNPLPVQCQTQNNTSSYPNLGDWSTTPYPVLKDFTTFGM